MDIDDLADRVWDAVQGKRTRTLRRRTNRDPIWIGVVLLIGVISASSILSWHYSIAVVGVLMLIGCARLLYLRRTTPRDDDTSESSANR